MRLPSLQIWLDQEYRSVADQMAIDECLHESATRSDVSVARFYTWDRPARTIGYFSRRDASLDAGAVRRLTGGGAVEHGEDVTFLLAAPPGTDLSRARAEDRYRFIHECLSAGLAESGISTRAAPSSPPSPGHHGGPGACFANPVDSDLLADGGLKIAGGAQRRIRGALLHQGSVRVPPEFRSPNAPWVESFASNLAEKVVPLDPEIRFEVTLSAPERALSRYSDEAWNGRR